MANQILGTVLSIALTTLWAGDALAEEVSWIDQFGTAGSDFADGVAADAYFGYSTGRVSRDLALPGQTSAGSVDAFVRKYDGSGNIAWTRQFGTPEFDGFSKIATRNGILYVAGLTTGTFPGETAHGGVDTFIRTYDADGNVGWTRQLGTAGGDFALDVAVDDTSIYVLGFTSGVFPGQLSAGSDDFFLAKLTLDGSLLWVRQFGTAGLDPAIFTLGGVAVDATGIYVGSTVPLALPGQVAVGDADAFLRKYDLDGNELWTYQFGTPCLDVLSDIDLHGGDVLMAGATTGILDNPGFPRCTNPPEGRNNSGGQGSTFVQRRSSNGAVLWTEQYKGSSGLTGFTLAKGVTANDAGVFVASEAITPRNPRLIDLECPIGSPSEDIDVRMLAHDGHLVWTRQIGSTARDTPSGIAVNDAGVLVAGTTGCRLESETSAGAQDAFTLQLTP